MPPGSYEKLMGSSDGRVPAENRGVGPHRVDNIQVREKESKKKGGWIGGER